MRIRNLLLSVFAAALVTAPQATVADVVEIPAEDAAGTQAAEALTDEAPRYYTIVKGDTLWDITHKFLDDPFRWPKVWRLNPYIKNPHLIYPGNVVRITPNGIEIVEGDRPEDLPVVGLEADETRVVTLEPEPEPEPEPVPPPPPMFGSNSIARDGFITDEELKRTGAIVDAAERQILISADDRVFISFKDRRDVEPGDRYTIFKVGRSISHPVTGKKMGNLISVLGSLTVTDTGKVVEARVDNAFKEIEKGALLKEYVEPVTEVEITEPGSEVDGRVVTALEGQVEMAAGDVVYIDKGRSDGLEGGNLMRIFRKNRKSRDPVTNRKVDLPLIDLGTLIVIEAKDRTSACVVIESLRSIRRGDMVSTMHAAR